MSSLSQPCTVGLHEMCHRGCDCHCHVVHIPVHINEEQLIDPVEKVIIHECPVCLDSVVEESEPYHLVSSIHYLHLECRDYLLEEVLGASLVGSMTHSIPLLLARARASILQAHGILGLRQRSTSPVDPNQDLSTE